MFPVRGLKGDLCDLQIAIGGFPMYSGVKVNSLEFGGIKTGVPKRGLKIEIAPLFCHCFVFPVYAGGSQSYRA